MSTRRDIDQQIKEEFQIYRDPEPISDEPEDAETGSESEEQPETSPAPELEPELEPLTEQLEALQIEETNMSEETTNNQSLSSKKKIVGEPKDFMGNRIEFEDWWRSIKLYIIVKEIDTHLHKIITATNRMKGGVAGLFARGWEDKILKPNADPNWDIFSREVEEAFSLGDKREIAEVQVETFKQGNQNIHDFMIKFGALADLAKIDDAHIIFLLKRHVNHEIIKTIMGYPPNSIPTTLDEWGKAIISVGKGREANQNRYDLVTATGTTYGGSGAPMEIGGKRLEWSSDGKPKCLKCGRFGHIKKNCRSNGNYQGSFQGIKCYNCQKMGHISKNCRAPRVNNIPKIRAITNGDEEGVDETPKNQDFPKGSE